MKRPIAIVLTIAIFAAIAVCFLRPGDLNPDFGYADIHFSSDDDSRKLSLSGDSDRVEARFIGVGDDGGRTLSVCFWAKDETKTYAFTSSEYANGALIEKTDIPDILVERSGNGCWERCDDVRYTPVMSLPMTASNRRNVVDAPTILNFFFPIDIAGKYRVTFFFRECAEPHCTASNLSTAGELLSVWFELSVPVKTAFEYDVYSPYIKYVEETGAGIVELLIRSNREQPLPYLDKRSIALFRETQQGQDYAGSYLDGGVQVLYLSDEALFWREVCGWEASFGYYGTIALPDASRSDEYVLKMTFTEHPDGSGEQYTLTLRLRFTK